MHHPHPSHDPDHHDPDHHDEGLHADLTELRNRRAALGVLGAAGAAVLAAACSGARSGTATTAPDLPASAAADAAGGSVASTDDGSTCASIPEETAGPYPADGSNGPNVLTEAGVVRSDLATSFGSSTDSAEGAALTIELVVLDIANGCAPYGGAAVYLWHCDRDGAYSLYSPGLTDQNYLRGVQPADPDGTVRFSTIFPGCYPGRWPHAHFEVYPDLDAATSASTRLATSQLALPEDICAEVYRDVSGYSTSARNLSGISIETDNVFSDGVARELGTVSGSIDDGLTVRLMVPV